MVTYKPFTHTHKHTHTHTKKKTSMSGDNAYGLKQVLDFTGNTRKQACTGDHIFTSRKEGKRFDVSFPTENQRSSRPSSCLTYHQPGTEHHVPRPNRRPAQTASTAKRDSSLETYLDPPTHFSPKYIKYLYPNSPQNLEGKPRRKDKPAATSPVQLGALRRSVMHNQVRERSLSSRRSALNETPVRLTCSFGFFFSFFAAKLGKHLVLDS